MGRARQTMSHAKEGSSWELTADVLSKGSGERGN